MTTVDLNPGAVLTLEKRRVRVKALISLDAVLVEDCETGITNVVEISRFRPKVIYSDLKPAADLSSWSDAEWDEARRREAVIKPLTEMSRRPASVIEEAGVQLSLSRRQIYQLIRAYRVVGNLTALIPRKSSGGRGKPRLRQEIETIIAATINEVFLTKQKPKKETVVEEVRRRCYKANLKPPAAGSIRRRIDARTASETLARREGKKAAQQAYDAVVGSFPGPGGPLDVVQIDHTPVDLIIVDEKHRQPIGRPYLTIAIDIFSRCITGFCLSLEAPSATSVGLCLAHGVLPKEEWLISRKLEGSWPIWGKPVRIHVDNASEFHSEALRRGCDAHGIIIDYRPVGKPRFGGTVERLIGTLMQLVHRLPGTTFSNITERGDYDSEAKAALTLAELERWLAVVITEYYHNKLHTSLNQPPIDRYHEGIFGKADLKGRGFPPRIQNKRAFLIDFLPIERRTLQRHGFMLDRIAYFSDALRPLLGEAKGEKFLIRRDPRDLSRIYVLDPRSERYLEVPYRTLSRPSITLWEHRRALKNLRDRGVTHVDEAAIFRAINTMKAIADEAAVKTRSARRFVERTALANASCKPAADSTAIIDSSVGGHVPAKPFADIEEW